MKTNNLLLLLLIVVLFSSCGSIKSTIMNVDNAAVKPLVKNNQFILTEYSTDSKYGYNKDYPINLGFENEKYSQGNIALFFNAIAGPNGAKISYEKIDTCCPFPTKRNIMGAGTLEVYQVTIEGTEKKIVLYINLFEKGKIVCPKGFTIKNTK
ncbi:2-dehydro-3-deoxyphosphooctonate aldolase [Flavobacterium sp.]|uniref:2-dehydro-3-deoxyphosphooctonate aldolase n=1 Tax=Flavobacterium sp. TaxID=239 RepID=UPI0037530346